MFGGLEVKGNDTKKAEPKPEAPPPASATTSGFEFLSSSLPVTNVADSAPTPVPAPTNSGFSFLASPAVPSEAEATVPASPKKEVASTTPAASASSGFSFLAEPVSAPAPTKPTDSTNTIESSSTPQPSEDAVPDSSTTTAVDESKSSASLFSMLSSTIDAKPSIPAVSQEEEKGKQETSTSGNISINSQSLPFSAPVKPSASSTTPSPNTDILSMQNPAQPLGSGVVFGGAARPKIAVKKRGRAKKVGIGKSPQASQIPPPITPVQTPASTEKEASSSTTTNNDNNPPEIAKNDLNVMATIEPPSSEDLRNEADEAASNAERFMREKQEKSMNSSIHSNQTSYTGRYSGSGKAPVVEDYGVSDSSSGTFGTPNSQDDETYAQAKAAAKEAQSMAQTAGTAASSNVTATKIGGFLGGWLTKRGLTTSSSNNSVTGSTTIITPSASRERTQSDDHSDVVVDVSAHEKQDSNASVENEVSERELQIIREREQAFAEQEQRELEEEDLARRREEIKRREEQELELEKRRKEQEEEWRMQKEKDRQKQQMLQQQQQQQQQEEEQRRREEEEANMMETPSDTLQRMLSQFSVDLLKAMAGVGELKQERKALLSERSLAEKQERLVTQQISQAESQQMEAAENEDFDLADDLATIIERHQSEKQGHADILENIESQIEALDSKRVDVVGNVSGCFASIEKDLNAFLEEQVESDSIDSAQIMAKFEETSKRIANQSEGLAADLKNIERDDGFLKEEKKTLESTISEETQEVETLRDEASEKLSGIQEEVEELRQQLARKEEEAASMEAELNKHETSISHIRSKFSRQLTRLERKETALEESRTEYLVEELAFKKLKKAHEDDVAAHSESLLNHEKIVTKIKSELSTAEALGNIISKEVVVENSVHSPVVDTNGDLLKIQAEVVNNEAAVDEAKQILNAAESFMTRLKDEIKDFEDRLPVLESEKKAAASQRDFKAAAKASKEIKALAVHKERCEKQLAGEAEEKYAAAQESVKQCVEKLEENMSVAHEMEKKSSHDHMIALVKKMNKYEYLKEKTCSNLDSDDDDNDEGISVRTLGGVVLDEEIEALKLEGESLDATFGGWEEIIAKYKDSLGDDEESHESVPETSTEEVTKENIVDDEDSEKNQEESQDDEVADVTDANVEECSEEQKIDKSEKLQKNIKELQVLEEKLAVSIEEEEYEEAADLDEKMKSLREELLAIGFSDADIDEKMQGDCCDNEQKEDNNENNEVEKVRGNTNDDKSHCSTDNNDNNEMTEQPVSDDGEDPDEVSLDKDDNINEPISDEAQVSNEEELNDGHDSDSNSEKCETNEEKQIGSDSDK